jgi:hypothetical protein
MMSRSLLRLTAGPLSAVLLLTACYRYVPVTGGDLVLGDVYRGHLTSDGTQLVARTMGADVGAFDGRLLTSTDTALVVSVASTVRRADPRRMIWSGEELVIPRSAVGTFERRELDGRRTVGAVLLTALGIAATGAIWLSIKGRVSGNPGGGPPVTPF